MSEAPAADGLTIGETVGNYVIEAKIGEGGMGAVYRAAHPLLGRKAAVKVLLPEHSKRSDLVTRFFNEAKTAASLRHPALVEVFDFGFLPNGSGYLVMDYLEGESLHDRLERVAPLPPEGAAEIARQIAAGVAAAHSQSIVHRDLKPDNVFLVPDPEMPAHERVKILDFGIAKLVLPSTTGSKGATSTGMLLGTPLFMAPEQCRGAGQVDHRADIYSVGCILYMMLTGRPPFNHEGVGEILAAHLHEPVKPPRTIDATLPVSLEAIVMRALAKKPDERYQTMAELQADLTAFLYPEGAGTSSMPSLSRGSAPRVPVPGLAVSPSAAARASARGSAASTAPDAAPRVSTPFATTLSGAAESPPPPAPQARPPRPAPKGGSAGWIVAAVVLVGGVAAGAVYLGRMRNRPRPPASAGAPPPVVARHEPPPSESAPPAPSTSGTPTPAAEAPAPGPEPDAAPAPEPATEPEPAPATEPAPAVSKDAAPAHKPPRKPPAERRPPAQSALFQRAVDLRARGDEAQALRAFSAALRAGGLSSEDHAFAEEQLISLRRKFGELEVQCDLMGATVSIDGRAVGRTPLAEPLLVRPGTRRLLITGPGYRPIDRAVQVPAGQKAFFRCR